MKHTAHNLDALLDRGTGLAAAAVLAAYAVSLILLSGGVATIM
ncbi:MULTISPECIES: hypothetical protein [Parvibaculum]|nr:MULTISPECIES: hypothetical protein [Parvibaculum]NIJ43330.1 hypothetical protein [Parvibaculum indicum]